MTGVTGRRWPHAYPFATILDGGKLMVRDGFALATRPGDFCWETDDNDFAATPEQVRYMSFRCPVPGSDRHCGTIEVGLNHKPDGPGATWQWDGDMDRPTLTPSVNCTGCECRWHGHLKSGVWTPC